MKILLSEPVAVHGAFAQWMSPSLIKMGHTVSTYDPDELCEQYGIELYRRILLHRVETERPDVVISYPPYDLLRPEDGATVRARGARLVGFAYDDPIFLESYTQTPERWESVRKQFHQTYDLYLSTSRAFCRLDHDRYTDGPFYPRHIRWAVNTPEPLPDPSVERDIPLILCGRAYPRRVEMVRHLLKNGIVPQIFGASNWTDYPDVAQKCYKGQLSRPSMFAAYRRAKIALAPCDWESMSVPMVKLRALEIVSCGACLLHENCPDLMDYFDTHETVRFEPGNWEDLVQAIQIMQTAPWPVTLFGKQGYDRLVREHTWETRWPEIEAMLSMFTSKPTTNPVPIQTSKFTDGDLAYVFFPENPSQDTSLCVDMAQISAAHHYEAALDYQTALEIYRPSIEITFAQTLGYARCLFALRNYGKAETAFLVAADLGKNLCSPAIDCTVTQRKFGLRKGLGHLFRGIFPRWLEAECYLMLIYGMDNTPESRVAGNVRLAKLPDDDHRFIALSGTFTEETSTHALPPEALELYLIRLCNLTSRVWAGTHQQHLAEFWTMRASAVAQQDKPESEIRSLLETALTHNPKRGVRMQIDRMLDALNREDEMKTADYFE